MVTFLQCYEENEPSHVDQYDVGSDFGFLADPILNIKRSDNPTESYRIPGDGITSESDGKIRSDYM